MTYCVGIMTHEGLVMASDSRSNAGYDQVNICRKMHTFVTPGERVFVLLCSGSLSCSQSVVTLLRRDFDQGLGLAAAGSLYDAARVVGDQVRRVSDMDRKALEQDEYKFNVHFILAGQIRGQPHDLYLIYPQGNPLRAHRGFPVPPDRRVQVRPADPRPGHPLRADHPGGRRPVRPDLDRLDHPLQRHRRPADRPAGLLQGRAEGHAATAGSPPRTPTSWPSTPSGSRPSARPSRNCRPVRFGEPGLEP